jgi:hypothetical protein
MEPAIWLVALGLSLITLVLALVLLLSRGISLAKKLKPFANRIARFRKDAQLYPEAVRLFTDLAKAQQTPAKKPRSPKG